MKANSHRLPALLALILAATLGLGCNPEGAKPSPTAAPGKATPTAADEEIPLTAIIATVNGEPITEKQVVAEAEPLLKNQGFHPGSSTWKRAFEERRGPLLDTLITRTLILQHARDSQIIIPNQPERVEAAMAEIRRSFASDELFQKFLYEQEMSEQDLRDHVLLEMKSAELLRQKGEEEPVVVSPEEVTAYYNTHPEFFQDRLHLRVIAIYIKHGDDVAERNEKRGLAQAAKARLDQNPGDFDTVAREYSDDPKAKETGGDMGFLRPDEVDPAIRDAVANVAPGAILGPIESGLAYYIVKLEKRGQDLSEYDLREDLAKELGDKKRAENVAQWLERVKRSSRTTITIAHEHYRRFFNNQAELLTP